MIPDLVYFEGVERCFGGVSRLPLWALAGLVMYGARGLDVVAVVPPPVCLLSVVGQDLELIPSEGPTSPGGEMSRQDPKTKTRARTGNHEDRSQESLYGQGYLVPD